jgi:hypothetical protein
MHALCRSSIRLLCTCTSRGLKSPPMKNADGWPQPRSGLTSELHDVLDTNGLPVRLALTIAKPDGRRVLALLAGLKSGSNVACRSADREYDAE